MDDQPTFAMFANSPSIYVENKNDNYSHTAGQQHSKYKADLV